MMDMAKIRADFPGLDVVVNKRPMVYLDSAATTQAPRQVIEAITEGYTSRKANVHRGVHTLSQLATAAMERARAKVAEFINAGSDREIIFTRGTTEAINLVASSFGQLLENGDEIILTDMEHHSNIVPWQLLQQRKHIVIKVVPINNDGSMNLDEYRRLFTPRTRVVACTHVSNVLGTINPVAQIIEIAHAHGAKVLIDGAQAIAHLKVDVRALDADFYAFSAHKMYGPNGVGVLYGRRELLELMPPYQGGGEMIGHVSFTGTTWAELPYKFEAGTPDFVNIAAFTAAIEYLESLGIENVEAHEQELLRDATRKLQEIDGIRIFGTAPHKCGVISFLLNNAHHYDTGVLLDQLGVEVRTGHHCAQPLMQTLGIEGTVRASFGVYNTAEDVDAFIAALRRIAPLLA